MDINEIKDIVEENYGISLDDAEEKMRYILSMQIEQYLSWVQNAQLYSWKYIWFMPDERSNRKALLIKSP